MIEQTLWVDRKFNFDFPAGLYPCILERMRGTPLRVEDLLRNISDQAASERIKGKWSIKEHVGHLVDLEELHEERLDEFMESKAILSAADMSNRKTSDARHNEKTKEQLITQLRVVRLHFIQRLELADDYLVTRKAIHPRLSIPMRLVDMLYFVSEHDDHHLAAMRAIIKNAMG